MIGGMNSYAVLADLVLAIHFAVVLFVVGGLLAVLAGGWRGWEWVRNFGFRLAHLAAIGIVVAQAWLGRLCPLTVWEQDLRRLAGQPGHEQSFIEYWIGRMLFFDLPWWVFVAAYTVFAGVVIASWWWVPPRTVTRRARRPGA